MKQKKNPQKPPSLRNYAYYSNIAIQMGVIIFAGVWGGNQLDKNKWIEFPLFTILFSFIAVALAIYIAIKDLIKKNNK
jgi:hypothetical protein